eukprot:scaffold26716_cov137-Cylindrotheca_fusiformis.AAC.2
MAELSRNLRKEESSVFNFSQSSVSVQTDYVAQSVNSDSISSLPTLATIHGSSLGDSFWMGFSKRTLRSSSRSLGSICEPFEDKFEGPESKILDELTPQFVMRPREKDHCQKRWE